jgi:glycosyltransferase involved in cell wall biosynthesis
MDKIKLLVVSDDIRHQSGVGIQCEKLLTRLYATGNYDIAEIAGSLVQYPPQVVNYKGIRLYPTPDGYGNPNLLRKVMDIENPDIVLFFSDPRFFEYAFSMDCEIRKKAKIVFYHTWDNEPFPRYNTPWYAACDKIVMLSEFSHNLLSQGGIETSCIQHGIDPQEFFVYDPGTRANERAKLLSRLDRPDVKFIVFWNNRNMARKRGADVISIFKKFYKNHPDSLLIMHTNPHDPEGTNLLSVIDGIEKESEALIMMSSRKVTTEVLNNFYNIADVTLNIAYNEGFGLCVAESLCAGTPVIATKTGGMTEQMTATLQDGQESFALGALLEPKVRTLYGFPNTPYVYGDYVSDEQVLEALESAYDDPIMWKSLGLRGHNHIVFNFHADKTAEKWDKLLQEVMSSPSTYKSWSIK